MFVDIFGLFIILQFVIIYISRCLGSHAGVICSNSFGAVGVESPNGGAMVMLPIRGKDTRTSSPTLETPRKEPQIEIYTTRL